MDRPGVFRNFERRVLAARDAEFQVSAVSIWEMRLKYGACHPSGAQDPFFPERRDRCAGRPGRDISAVDHAPCRTGTQGSARPQGPVRRVAARASSGGRTQAVDRGRASCRPSARGRITRAWVRNLLPLAWFRTCHVSGENEPARSRNYVEIMSAEAFDSIGAAPQVPTFEQDSSGRWRRCPTGGNVRLLEVAPA